MYPEIHLGPLTLQTFGLMFALAFIGAGAIIHRRLGELDKPQDWAYEMAFAALIGGLIGARLYFFIDNYAEVKGDVLGNLFSGSGLTWYGGAIGGAIGVVLWAWWRKFLNLTLLDLAAPALAAGYAIGRIGCQLSGDGDYGKPHTGFPAMGYPDATVPTPPGVTVWPTPVFETIIMLGVALLLWKLRDRFRIGILFALYLICAGTERFFIEFLRTNVHVALGLTAAQLESLVMIVAGAIWMIVIKQRHGTLARADSPGSAAAVTS